MKQYSIYNAKARLSELIRFVKTKGPVVITERGEPVVQVIPIQKQQKGSMKSRYAELKDLGLIRPKGASTSSIKPIKAKPGAIKRFLDSRDD